MVIFSLTQLADNFILRNSIVIINFLYIDRLYEMSNNININVG
jgi:hypothetical protein